MVFEYDDKCLIASKDTDTAETEITTGDPKPATFEEVVTLAGISNIVDTYSIPESFRKKVLEYYLEENPEIDIIGAIISRSSRYFSFFSNELAEFLSKYGASAFLFADDDTEIEIFSKNSELLNSTAFRALPLGVQLGFLDLIYERIDPNTIISKLRNLPTSLTADDINNFDVYLTYYISRSYLYNSYSVDLLNDTIKKVPKVFSEECFKNLTRDLRCAIIELFMKGEDEAKINTLVINAPVEFFDPVFDEIDGLLRMDIVDCYVQGKPIADLKGVVTLFQTPECKKCGYDSLDLLLARMRSGDEVHQLSEMASFLASDEFGKLRFQEQSAIRSNLGKGLTLDEAKIIFDVFKSEKFTLLDYSKQEAVAYVIKIVGYIKDQVTLDKAVALYEQMSKCYIREIDKIKKELLEALIELPLDEGKAALVRIIELFRHNNLPLIGKQYKIFEILYLQPDAKGNMRFIDVFKEKKTMANLSPYIGRFVSRYNKEEPNAYLRGIGHVALRRRIWSDLLTISIESCDRDLMSYLEALISAQDVLEAARMTDFKGLSSQDEVMLKGFFDRLDAISQSSNPAHTLISYRDEIDIRGRCIAFTEDLGVTVGQSILDRISELYLSASGYRQITEVLDRMNKVKDTADLRNQNNPWVKDGIFEFGVGDLLKAVNGNTLPIALLQGLRSREYIGIAGGGANSDFTPYDADFSRVTKEDVLISGQDSVVSMSIAGNGKYGNYVLVVKNRGQFYRRENGEQYKGIPEAKFRPEPTTSDRGSKSPKYELIYSHYYGEKHFGVRTGLPSTEIDAIVLLNPQDEQSMDELFFQIANNGFYIPVCNKEGKVLFSKENFSQFKLSNRLLNSIIDGPTSTPHDVMTVLKSCPFMKRILEMDSGVDEKYTLETHTIMVLQQFDKYFGADYRSTILSKREMRLLIILHDIGKSLASASGKKKDQHEYTKNIMLFALPSLGVSPKQADRIIRLMNQDIIGELFKGDWSSIFAPDKVRELALLLECRPLELLELLRMFYICDAGSYTEDASGDPQKNALGKIFVFGEIGGKRSVDFAVDYKKKFESISLSLT